MTQPTQAICPILLEDYRKIGLWTRRARLTTSQMIKDCMKKVVAVHLHQTVQVSSLTPAPQLTLLPSQGPLEAEGERGAQLRSSTEQGSCHSWLCLSVWKMPKRASVPSEYTGAGRAGQRPGVWAQLGSGLRLWGGVRLGGRRVTSNVKFITRIMDLSVSSRV